MIELNIWITKWCLRQKSIKMQTNGGTTARWYFMKILQRSTAYQTSWREYFKHSHKINQVSLLFHILDEDTNSFNIPTCNFWDALFVVKQACLMIQEDF